MPALAADIGPALRAARIASIADATVRSRFPAARDGRDDPAEGFFDSEADAVAALEQRSGLIGTVRRRFTVSVQQAILPDIAAGVPTWRLIDAEQGVDAPCMVSRIEMDLEQEETTVELFG